MTLRLLIVDDRRQPTGALASALRAAGFSVIAVIADGDTVAAQVAALAPDAIIIDADSPTRDSLEGLAAVGRRHPRPIVMLSGQGGTELVREAARRGISAYVVDGRRQRRSPVSLRRNRASAFAPQPRDAP